MRERITRWLQTVRASTVLNRLLFTLGGVIIGVIIGLFLGARLLYSWYASQPRMPDEVNASVPSVAPSSSGLSQRWFGSRSDEEQEDAGAEEDATPEDVSSGEYYRQFDKILTVPDCRYVPRSVVKNLLMPRREADCNPKGLIDCSAEPVFTSLEQIQEKLDEQLPDEDERTQFSMCQCKWLPFDAQRCERAKSGSDASCKDAGGD